MALPLVLSSSGSTVRVWDVDSVTCLKLLQHCDNSPVTGMVWISTFKGILSRLESRLREYVLNVPMCIILRRYWDPSYFGRSEFEDGLGSGDFVSGYSYHMSVRTGLPDRKVDFYLGPS
jgi:hypothetical protein